MLSRAMSAGMIRLCRVPFGCLTVSARLVLYYRYAFSNWLFDVPSYAGEYLRIRETFPSGSLGIVGSGSLLFKPQEGVQRPIVPLSLAMTKPAASGDVALLAPQTLGDVIKSLPVESRSGGLSLFRLERLRYLKASRPCSPLPGRPR